MTGWANNAIGGIERPPINGKPINGGEHTSRSQERCLQRGCGHDRVRVESPAAGFTNRHDMINQGPFVNTQQLGICDHARDLVNQRIGHSGFRQACRGRDKPIRAFGMVRSGLMSTTTFVGHNKQHSPERTPPRGGRIVTL